MNLPVSTRSIVVLLTAGAGLLGCTASPTVAAGVDAPPSMDQDPTFASPEATLEAFFRSVASADWPVACSHLDTTWKSYLAQAGEACEVYLSEEFDEGDRARLDGFTVNTDAIEVTGTVAELHSNTSPMLEDGGISPIESPTRGAYGHAFLRSAALTQQGTDWFLTRG
ncbi:hypothetical protein [Geodermatophilus sp. SYSU D01105]